MNILIKKGVDRRMSDKKLISIDNLDKISKGLDARYKEMIQDETERASTQEQLLKTELNSTKDMLGGKSIRYITQAEYDVLSEAEKNSLTITYFITDAKDTAHEHENKEFLDNLAARNIAIGNKVHTFDGTNDLSYSISDIGAAPASHNHDDRYYTETEANSKFAPKSHNHDNYATTSALSTEVGKLNTAIGKKSDSGHTHDNYLTELDLEEDFENIDTSISNINTQITGLQTSLAGKSDKTHNHNDVYYTETEIDDIVEDINETITSKETALQTAIDEKAASGHNHDDRYYTESEMNTKLAAKADTSHGTHIPAPQTANNATFLRNDNSWQKVTPANIGAAASSHTHDDRYYTETKINTKIEEINESISSNVSTLEGKITTAKSGAISESKSYTDTAITALVGSAPEAMNTLNELAKAINDHQDEYEAYVGTVSSNIATAKSEAIAEAAKKDTALHTTISAEIDADVKAEKDRAMEAENALQTAINGKANSSHGTHVTWATNAPKANGTAAVGTVARVAREDHIHPLQESVSGNAGSANKVNKALKIQLNGGTKEGTNQFLFDGSTAKNINITASNIGASPSGHTHDDRYYTETEVNGLIEDINETITQKEAALQASINGKANSSHGTHVPTPQTANNAKFLRNDNSWQTVTPANIGAAAASHGNHVPATQTASNKVFLRNDNTWATITPANIGAAAASHGTHVPTPQTANNAKFLRNDNSWQTVTPANIGAEPRDNTVATVSVASGELTLTTAKRQKCTNLVSGTQIVFPTVSTFTEIHLYFSATTNMNLTFPNCKWRVDPNLEAGKSYEIVATYNTMEWLVNVIVYS